MVIRKLPSFLRIVCIALAVTFMALPVLADSAVKVRGGIHKNYNRLVFDFSDNTDVTVKTSDQAVELAFTNPAQISFADVQKQALPFIKAYEASSTNPLTVRLTLARPVAPKLSKDGKKIIVDLYPGAARGDTPPASTAPPAADTPAKAPAPQAQPENDKIPLELTPWSEQQDLAAQPKPEQPAAPAETPPPAATPVPEAAPKAEAPPPAPEKHAEKTGQDDDGITESSVLQIDVAQPVPVAAFQRGRNLWLVFGGNVKGLPYNPDARMKSANTEIERYELGNGTAYRILASKKLQPQLKFAEKGLRIEFAPPVAKETVLNPPAFNGMAQINPQSRVMDFIIPADGPAAPIKLKDPETGDNLIIVPFTSTSEMQSPSGDYVQYRLLPTLRGLVFAPKVDDLGVMVESKMVRVTNPAGIYASGKDGMFSGSASRIFALEDWQRKKEIKGKAGASVRSLEMALEKDLVSADKDRRADILLKLAQLLFSNGYGQEAQGWVKMLLTERPEMATRPSIRALRGAISVLTRNYDQAVNDFSTPELNREAEIYLWQAYMEAQKENWVASRTAFQRAGGLLFGYAEPFQIPFMFAATDMALALEDPATADYLLDNLERQKDNLKPRDMTRYRYLRAMALMKKGKDDDAKKAFKKVMKNNDGQFRPKAEYALVNLQLADESIKPEEAAEKLESLRFSWRGGSFERMVLNRLADLYTTMQKPRPALDALRVIIRNFPDTDDAAIATKRLQDQLMAEFSDENLARLSPVEAAALYQDYHELIADPKSAIDIKRKLADQMISVGFLEQADAWLSELAETDLTGPDKSKAWLQLAGIRLVNNQADKALLALDQWAKLPVVPDQAREGVLLRARALMVQQQYDAALDQLKDLQDKDALRLKADIDWRAQRWAEAAKALGALIGPADPMPEALDDEQASLVLNRAVALALAGDQPGLQSWAQLYGELMTKTQLASAFDLVTRSPKDGSLSSVQAIQQKTGEIDLFKNFLKNYAPATPPASGAATPASSAGAAPAQTETPATPKS